MDVNPMVLTGDYMFLGQENDMQKTQVPGTNLHAYEK